MKYRKSCGEEGVTPQLFTYGKLLRSMDEVKPRSCSMAQWGQFIQFNDKK